MTRWFIAGPGFDRIVYRIFHVPAAASVRIDAVLKDDRVSRQSIAVRDAEALGLRLAGTLVIVEGEEAALRRAEELFHGIATALPSTEADAVYRALKAQEDSATSGMGLIFG